MIKNQCPYYFSFFGDGVIYGTGDGGGSGRGAVYVDGCGSGGDSIGGYHRGGGWGDGSKIAYRMIDSEYITTLIIDDSPLTTAYQAATFQSQGMQQSSTLLT